MYPRDQDQVANNASRRYRVSESTRSTLGISIGFSLGPSTRHRGRRLRRPEGRREERRSAPVRQLNFSSFGTQLVAPGGGVPPLSEAHRLGLGPEDRACRALPASLGPRRDPGPGPARPRSQEGPTAIDPDLRAPNERDCQRKPTCRTRTCRTRFCVAPPVPAPPPPSQPPTPPPPPLGTAPCRATPCHATFPTGSPSTSSFPPSFDDEPTAPPALPFLLPSLLLSYPNRPNSNRDCTSDSFLLSLSSSFVFPSSLGSSHRVPHAIREGPCPGRRDGTGENAVPRTTCRGMAKRSLRLKIPFVELSFFLPFAYRFLFSSFLVIFL